MADVEFDYDSLADNDIGFVTGQEDYSDGSTDMWTESGNTLGEYYYSSSQLLSKPTEVVKDGVTLTEVDSAGALAEGEWAWDDVDGLGYNTVYVKKAFTKLSDGGSTDLWTESGATAGEYYYTGSALDQKPDEVLFDGNDATEGTAGSLAEGEWAWGNEDGLASDTVYVRIPDSPADPDSQPDGYVQSYLDIDSEPAGFVQAKVPQPVVTNSSSGQRYFVRHLIVYNGNTGAEAVKLFKVPGDGSGGEGVALPQHQFAGQDNNAVIDPGRTAHFEYPIPGIIMVEQGDTIKAVTDTGEKVTVQAYGGVES